MDGLAQAAQPINVVTEIQALSRQLASRDAIQAVTTFSGDAKKFKQWVKQLERQSVLIGFDDTFTKRLAFQTSEGPVGDFLQRYLADHPNDTWVQIKAELTLRFSETVDAGHAMSLLRHIKQNSFETVHLFAKRMLDLGKDAFPGQDLTDLTIGRQLVEIFVDGLKSSAIARKILRENPQTLQAAVTTASTEYNLFQKFRLRHREDTPMEIGVVEGKKAEWVEKSPPKFESASTVTNMGTGR